MADNNLSDTLKDRTLQYIKQGEQNYARFCVEKGSQDEKNLQSFLGQSGIKYENVESKVAGNTLRFSAEDGKVLEDIMARMKEAENAASAPVGSGAPSTEHEEEEIVVADVSLSNEDILKTMAAKGSDKVEDVADEIKEKKEPEKISAKEFEEKPKEPEIKDHIKEINQISLEIAQAEKKQFVDKLIKGENIAKEDKVNPLKAVVDKGQVKTAQIKDKNKKKDKGKKPLDDFYKLSPEKQAEVNKLRQLRGQKAIGEKKKRKAPKPNTQEINNQFLKQAEQANQRS